jgi:hypothetical protein
VADQGAVRFNVPEAGIIEPDSDSIKFHDRKPPNDNCVLAFSYRRLPAMDGSGLPLSELIPVAMDGDPRGVSLEGEIVQQRRPDLELAWTDFCFMEQNEHRQARSRICIARHASRRNFYRARVEHAGLDHVGLLAGRCRLVESNLG